MRLCCAQLSFIAGSSLVLRRLASLLDRRSYEPRQQHCKCAHILLYCILRCQHFHESSRVEVSVCPLVPNVVANVWGKKVESPRILQNVRQSTRCDAGASRSRMFSHDAPFPICRSAYLLAQTGGCAALVRHASIAESMHAPPFDARPSRDRGGVLNRFHGDGRSRSEVMPLDT